eukprot:2546966-Pyramimonas_sp.AAC.1
MYRHVNDERADAPSFLRIHFRIPRRRTQLTNKAHGDEIHLQLRGTAGLDRIVAGAQKPTRVHPVLRGQVTQVLR